jgi:hypothetical protein
MDEIVINTKICCRCKTEKNFSEFRKSKSGKYSLHGMCKNCHDIDSKEKYNQNRERRILEISVWQEGNPHKTDKYNAKWRQKKIKEKRKLKRELKSRPELINEDVAEKIEMGENPDF